MGNCGLCETLNDKERFICENENAFCIVILEPLKEGHVMILPKRHITKKSDLTAEESGDLFHLIDKLQTALKKSYNEDSLIIMNTGRHCSQEHLHIHMLPSKGNIRDLYVSHEGLIGREKGNKVLFERIRNLIKDNL